MTVNTRSDLATIEDENLTNHNANFNVPCLVHSDGKKAKSKFYPLSFFATHTLPQIVFFHPRSLSICIEHTLWYQYFIFTEKNIFVFTHKENIFTSQFSQIYLFPGISLRLIWQVKAQGPDQVWPGPEWRPEWGAAWRGTQSGDGAGATGGHSEPGVIMVDCARPGIKLGCFEDKYRDYEFSFDPSNGNCVWLCCYSSGAGYSVVVLPGLLSLSKLRDWRKYLSCLLIYVTIYFPPTNRDSHEPGPWV